MKAVQPVVGRHGRLKNKETSSWTGFAVESQKLHNFIKHIKSDELMVNTCRYWDNAT